VNLSMRVAGWWRRADCLVAHRLDRANVVEEAAAQVDGEGFAAVEHVGEALCAASRR